MTSRLTRVFVAVLVAFALAGTATAYAHKKTHFQKQVAAALHDCGNSRNGSLKGHYTLKVLQTALNEVKAQAIQYTGCADVLTAAIRADSLGGGPKPPANTHKGDRGGGGGGGGSPHTKHASHPIRPNQKQIQSRVDQLGREGGSSLTLPTGQTVTPGTVTAHSASFLSSLPTPLVIVLAVLLAAVVAVSGRALQNVVRTRRSR